MRLGNSIPAKLLIAGSALLLVCGIGSAQNSNKAAGVNRPSKARFLTVSSSSTSRKNKKSRKRVSARQRGQQKIDPARAREIQEALIREHYMEGSASGVWDTASQNAMVRYQADNGWQSKVVPDSRALIKLGLGPDHDHLLNPESAMTSQPEPLRTSPMLNQSPIVALPSQK